MPSVDENLLANEQILFQSEKHWIAPVRDSLPAAGMILAALVITMILPSGGGPLDVVWGFLGLVRWGLLLAGAAWIAYNIVVWRTAAFAVTTLRVLRYEGMLQRRTSETLLSAVSDVKLNVGLIGRQLGYGDLRILTQSGDAGADRFASITQAAQFRNAMMEAKIAADTGARVRTATPDPGAAMPPLAPPAPAPAAPAGAPAHPAAPAKPSAEDSAARLLKLAELRDRGIISAEEFEAKKAEILARM